MATGLPVGRSDGYKAGFRMRWLRGDMRWLREQQAVEADHVVAGTGFRIDIARLPFLPDGLRDQIATLNGYPVVTRAGESSVPGLYFAGAPAAVSPGPSVRFIAGTHTSVRQLARSLAHRAKLAPAHQEGDDSSLTTVR